MADPGRTEEVLRISAALHYFLWTRCQLYGIEVAKRALARPDPVPTPVRAKALCCIGDTLASTLGWESEAERREGLALLQKGIELSRRLPDQALTAWATNALAWVAESLGDHAKAARSADEAIERARKLGDDRLIGLGLGSLGIVASAPSQKRVLWQEAVAHLRRAGDLALCTVCLASLALLELEEEQFRAAADLLEEAIALSDRIGALFTCTGPGAPSAKPASCKANSKTPRRARERP